MATYYKDRSTNKQAPVSYLLKMDGVTVEGFQSANVYACPDYSINTTNRGWRTIVQAGGNATNRYFRRGHKVVRDEKLSGSMIGYTRFLPNPPWAPTKLLKYEAEWSISAPPRYAGAPDLSASTALGQATSRMWKKLQEDSSHFNGLVSIGELRETIALIRRPASGLRDAIAKYVKTMEPNRFRPRHRFLSRERQVEIISKGVADSWLEFSLGVRPLVSDVRSAAETLARYKYEMENPRTNRLVSVGTYKVSRDFGESPLAYGGFPWSYVFSELRSSVHSVRLVVGLFPSRTITGSPERLAELSGLTWGQVPLAAYELIPWSFVFDYFANINEILAAACTSTSRVTFTSLTSRVVTDCRIVLSHRPSNVMPDGFVTWMVTSPTALNVTRLTEMTRMPWELTLPPLEFKTPLGNTIQMSNLLALSVSSSKKWAFFGSRL